MRVLEKKKCMPISQFGRKSFLLASLLSLVSACSSPRIEENTATLNHCAASCSPLTETGASTKKAGKLHCPKDDPQFETKNGLRAYWGQYQRNTTEKEGWKEEQALEKCLYDYTHSGEKLFSTEKRSKISKEK
jgi:hypothetical protein